MNMLEGELQKRAEDALRSCLKNVPFLEIRSIEAETWENEVRPDLLVNLELSGKEQKLGHRNEEERSAAIRSRCSESTAAVQRKISRRLRGFCGAFCLAKGSRDLFQRRNRICGPERQLPFMLRSDLYREAREPESFCTETRLAHTLFAKGAEGLASPSFQPQKVLENQRTLRRGSNQSRPGFKRQETAG